MLLDQFKRDAPRLGHSDAVGDGARGLDLGGLACLERRHVASGVLGLNTDDLDFASERSGLELCRNSHTSGQAPTADCDQNRVDVLNLVDHLEPDGSLALDDVDVVKWSDENGAGLGRVLLRRLQCLGKNSALEHDVSAVVLGCLKLWQRSAHRHKDRGLDAELARGEGNALSVISGRSGNHAALALIRT